MTEQKKPIILLTNDDGIHSPGLFASAEALSELGRVYLVAPDQQKSGAGRSLPLESSGIITPVDIHLDGQVIPAFSISCSPAQAVLHALLEVLPERPALVVSGINYGENVGTGVTISGTVGAALEAAAQGVPALAISLETLKEHHISNSEEVDFSTAAYFTKVFARLLLETRLLPDIDVLKVDIPAHATPDTEWKLCKISRTQYYEPVRPERVDMQSVGKIGYQFQAISDLKPGTDAYVLKIEGLVSVVPVSLDMTSRVNFEELQGILAKA